MNTRPQVAKQSAFVARHDPVFGLYMPPANHWLRTLYAALLRIKCLRECEGEIVTGDPVTLESENSLALIREADGLAAHTLVYNAGLRPAYIYEDAGIVAHIGGNAVADLPMPGLFTIYAALDGTEFVLVGFTTSVTYDGGADETTLVSPFAFLLPIEVGNSVRIGHGDVYGVTEVIGNTLVLAGHVPGGPVVTINLQTFAVLTAVTERRCLCGDTPATYYDDAPVGGFLL